jgi:isoleucyl-tRNA synthetase
MDFNESNTKVTKLIFVRHGETERNILDIDSKALDKWPLTEKGVTQVETTAKKIKDKVDIIISSPVLRAKQSAEIVKKHVDAELIFDDRIIELDSGEWNELTPEQRLDRKDFQDYLVTEKIPEQRFNFKLGTTGETRADVVERVKEFLAKIGKEYPGKTIVIVAHGAINGALNMILGNLDYSGYFQHERPDHELSHKFYLNSDGTAFDPHKPFVDEVEFTCKCGGTMKRTPEVMDVWFDSGSMPYAQYHYPFENSELFAEQYPADFICEAIDQTRGWFYTLLAISTIVKNNSCFKNVISTGHILDEKGQKMSKSKGNIVEPMAEFEKVGADVVRFFLYSVNQPGEPKLFSEKEVLSVSRNLFITLWNVYSFFSMYASIDGWKPSGKTEATNILDKWILAKFNELTETITESLDNYDTYRPANTILDFINELSTWYVRRSRRRFWKSESDSDKESAYHTLYEVLIGLSKLLAPFTPMFAETVYQGLKQESDPESVHLADFPAPEEFDLSVLDEMAETRQIVEAGLAKRSEAGIKVRQPLALLKYSGKKLSEDLETIIAEEVNVKKVVYVDARDIHIDEGDKNSGVGETGVELDTVLTDELKTEGVARELIRNIQSLRKKSGFEVENRIVVNYATSGEVLKKVMKSMSEIIAKEVLAKESTDGKIENPEGSEEFCIDGEKIWIGISRIK